MQNLTGAVFDDCLGLNAGRGSRGGADAGHPMITLGPDLPQMHPDEILS